MSVYRKEFTADKPMYIRNEVRLQKIAAMHGLAPNILKTDNKTFIEMVKLKEMNLGDMYGNDIDEIPARVVGGMFSLVWILYHICGIEYLDIWPRNFVEVDGRVWVIDFGDARMRRDKKDDYLESVFKKGRITKWNPEFA
jgi:tRNA A-37 threonylcarbamoyl transferase component Bud32